MLSEIARAIYLVGSVSGTNDKISLLKKYESLEGFKDVLKFIYNPYVRTGIGSTKLVKGRHALSCTIVAYSDALDYFTNHNTGSDMDICAAWHFINCQPDKLSKDLAAAIVTKTLKIGVTETTLNKVYGKDFIPKIGVMLGEKYPDFKDKVKGPYIVTEKLDGHRRVLVKENGRVSFYTRSGLPDEGLVEIEEEAQYLPDNTVYDGEFLAKGDFVDSIALRQATASIMNSKGERRGVTFNIFDMVPLRDFKLGVSNSEALSRKLVLASAFKDLSIQHLFMALIKLSFGSAPTKTELQRSTFNYFETYGLSYDFKHIKSVPILGIANNEQEILDFAAPIWQRRYEGVMLNTIDGLYEIKRSKNLLKVKHTEEYVLRIVDYTEGEDSFIGMLGSVIVEYKGERVGVGSGFTIDKRKLLWVDKESLIGRKVEVESFGESKDKYGKISLNCPIFKRFVGEED